VSTETMMVQQWRVGRGISSVLREAFSRAEESMEAELATFTVADVLRETPAIA
jgi:hypothetical protein